MLKKADVQKVIDRIHHTVRNEALADRLVDKVNTYQKTHNNKDDLSNSDAAMIYHGVPNEDHLKLNDGKPLKIQNTNHSLYREELRNFAPDKVNNAIRHELSQKRKNQDYIGEGRIKGPGNSTMVVDYDTRKETKPEAEARLITIFSSFKSRR